MLLWKYVCAVHALEIPKEEEMPAHDMCMGELARTWMLQRRLGKKYDKKSVACDILSSVQFK